MNSERVEHAAEVEADSFYEAVAVANFREDPLMQTQRDSMTEFTIAALRNPTEHKLRLRQVTALAEPIMRERPARTVKRQRVRTLLGS